MFEKIEELGLFSHDQFHTNVNEHLLLAPSDGCNITRRSSNKRRFVRISDHSGTKFITLSTTFVAFTSCKLLHTYVFLPKYSTSVWFYSVIQHQFVSTR